MKNSSYYNFIAPVGVRTHDLPHTVASNMVKQANEDDISNYKRVLDNILSKSITYEAMYCESVCCNDNGHLADIEQMCKYAIDACLKACYVNRLRWRL